MKKKFSNIAGTTFAIVAIGSTAALFAQQATSPSNSGETEKKASNVTKAAAPAQTILPGYRDPNYPQPAQYSVAPIPTIYPGTNYPGTVTPLAVAPGSYGYTPPTTLPPMLTSPASNYDSPRSTLVYEDPETGKLAILEPSEMSDESKMKLVIGYSSKINEAHKTFVSPKATAEAKADAKEIIAQNLRIRFDADLDQRRTRINELEEQLKQLREQVDRRESNKEKLVQLRLQLIENESEGLGFPLGWEDNTRPTNLYRASNVSNGLSTTSRDWVAPAQTSTTAVAPALPPAAYYNPSSASPNNIQVTRPAAGPSSR